ncbi:hypothetical protein C7U60_14095 [Mesorhizobium plurifarium]|nr:hypothetical protein C7U60_14095 [Mesorhizobium plurifarium]
MAGVKVVFARFALGSAPHPNPLPAGGARGRVRPCLWRLRQNATVSPLPASGERVRVRGRPQGRAQS